MFRNTCLQFLAVAPIFGLAFASALRADTETSVSGPHTHKNLSVYLIHGKSAAGPVPLTLEEALAKGFVEVHETDQVSSLTIENKGREEVFIQAGDIVKGGKQDRVVTATLVLPPKSGKINASVYCVEAGRWAPRGREDSRKFSSSDEMMPSKDARMALMAAPTATASIQRSNGSNGQSARADRPLPDDVRQRLQEATERPRANDAERSLTEPDQPRGGQSEVWAKVAEIQGKLSSKLKSKVNAAESESSLQLALENKELNKEREGYVTALQAAGTSRDDILGYAVAVNGEIVSADVYASNALFRKLWPRLLKAAATEAIGAEEKRDFTAPESGTIKSFLARSEAAEQSAPSLAGMTTATRSADDSFDAETRRADGQFLHRTKLKR